MSDEDFNGEKLTVTKVELGLVLLVLVIAAVPLLFGLSALVALGVLLAFVLLGVVLYLAKGGPTTADEG